MTAKRKTVVRVEKRSLMVVRPAHAPIYLWCQECVATVPMYLPERAAVLAQTTPREIYARVEKGELHFVETTEGELFICCHSLRRD